MSGTCLVLRYSSVFFLTFIFQINGETTDCPPAIPLKWEGVAQLGSTLLLPCSFTTGQLQQATKNKSAVVWLKKERNYIVEISISGQPSFWGSYGKQFQTFPSLAAKGNFSLLLNKLGEDDVGEYSCILYNGEHCVVGYAVCKIDQVKSSLQKDTYLAVGTGCGGILLLIFIMLAVYTVCKRRQKRRRDQAMHHPDPYCTITAAPTEQECQIYANTIYNLDY